MKGRSLMNTKRSIFANVTRLIVVMIFVGNLGMLSGAVLTQTPQPQPINQLPKLSLVPLVIVNVGLDNQAQPISSPTGASRPAVEFLLPRNGTKEFSVTTSGGNISVRFSNSVPAGVSAGAFEWVQSEVPAGNAIGRLRYSGCPSCPSSFTLDIGAT